MKTNKSREDYRVKHTQNPNLIQTNLFCSNVGKMKTIAVIEIAYVAWMENDIECAIWDEIVFYDMNYEHER